MANGKVVYPSSDPSPSTYTFVKNQDFGHKVGYLEDLDDQIRGLDGTLNSYAGPQKKTYELTFTRVLKAQLDFFLALWALQCHCDLYLDGTNKDATVKMMAPPQGTSEDAFVGDEITYSFDVRFEEV
jgi:hypothetical protein